MKQYRLGILGAGNMGGAIAAGAVQAGIYPPQEILMFNRTAEKRAAQQAQGYAVTDTMEDTFTQCDWVILGIKPQNFGEILPKLAACGVTEKPLVISIAAGVTFRKLEQALGADCPMIRVMPNTPLLRGKGASALVGNGAATPQQVAQVQKLLDSMGITVVFDREDALNDVIPYNGSLPAYVYAFIDAMAESAAQHGIAREEALRLICQTCVGAAEMVAAGTQTPAELIRAVCSPGGTTLEAVKVLETHDFAGILAQASDACIKRAYELGAE